MGLQRDKESPPVGIQGLGCLDVDSSPGSAQIIGLPLTTPKNDRFRHQSRKAFRD